MSLISPLPGTMNGVTNLSLVWKYVISLLAYMLCHPGVPQELHSWLVKLRFWLVNYYHYK